MRHILRIAFVVCTLPLASLTGQVLSTTFAGMGMTEGNMFDLQATVGLNVSSLDVNLAPGTWNLEVYFVAGGGSFVGNENNPMAWTLVSQVQGLVSNGAGVPTSLGALGPAGVALQAGVLQGVYVTTTNGAGLIDSPGTGVGNLLAQDANLSCFEGTANVYAFAGFSQPRGWNGRIHYGVLGCNLGSNIPVTLPPPPPLRPNSNSPPTEVTATATNIGLFPPITFTWTIMGQASPTMTQVFTSPAASWASSWTVPWTLLDEGIKIIRVDVRDSCPFPNTGTAQVSTCVYSDLDVSTNGMGDLDIKPPSVLCFTAADQGWSFASLDTSGPPGTFIPDALTQLILASPLQPGSLLHFPTPGPAGAYPQTPFSSPPGVFPLGLRMDIAVVYFNSSTGVVEHLSPVRRINF